MNQTIQKLIDTNAPMRFKPGADAGAVEKYEQAAGITIPASYREWLDFSDGGEIFVPGTEFYGVNADERFSLYSENDPKAREVFSLDASMLIVGQLNFGDLVCLDVNSGEIIQWDHELDEEYLRWTDIFSFIEDEITDYVTVG